MGKNISFDLEGIEKISAQAVKDFFSSKGFSVSEDFAEFYSKFNGASGEISGGDGEDDYVYIDIWNLNEIIESNNAYNVSKNIDDVIIFGSDMALGYNYKTGEYLIVPFIGMGFLEQPEYLGDNYNSFFENLLDCYSDDE